MRLYYSLLALLFCSAPLFLNAQTQACTYLTGLYGSYGATSPGQFGDPFLTENGITLGTTGFVDTTGGVSNTATFWAGDNLFSGAFTLATDTFIKTNPEANLIISVVAASEVTFDFIDWNSMMNFSVNGQPISVVNNLSDLPTNVAPGVIMTLNTSMVGPGIVGTVTLTGYITEVIVGGDNVGIDNICFIETTPICQITSLTATASSCDISGNFSVELDFNYSEEGNNGFTVSGNGTSYGTFDYAQLPITIPNLTGDNSTVYEFFVQDVDNPNCVADVVLGTVDCPVCTISNIVSDPSICINQNTYSIIIDFAYSNVNSVGFDISLNGNYLEYWTYAELPIELYLPSDGGTTHELTFCDSGGTSCCASAIVDQLDCAPAVCAITNVMATPSACIGLTGEFSVDLDFDYENAGSGFTVTGNGTNYGTFPYAQLPVNLGVFVGDGTTTYEFLITDNTEPNCTAITTVGPVSCPLPCEITGLQANTLQCTSDSTASIFVDFNSANTASTFNMYDGNGNFLATYNYANLPVTYSSFPVDQGQLTGTVTVCDTEDTSCCSSFIFDTPDCTPLVCAISNVVVTPGDCIDNTGEFEVSLNFDYENASTSFTVMGNGVNYGSFFYAELPITLGPLAGDGTTVYEFVVTDSNNPDCTSFTTVGPITCTIPCAITGLVVDPLQCTSDSTLSVFVNLSNTGGSATFNLFDGNGNNLGMYGYSQLPINTGNYPVTAGQTTGTITVCDSQFPDCCQSIIFDTPNCEPPACEISTLSLSPTACDDNGFFDVIIDFNYANTSSQFTVTGNGTTYGPFNYTDLPVTVGSYLGDGMSVLEFEVSDVESADCSSVEVMTAIDCVTQSCELFDLVVDPLQCTSDSTFSAVVNLNYQNVGANGFDVFVDGENVGFFDYTEIPFTITNLPASSGTSQAMVICDVDNPNCCVDASYTPIFCAPVDCEIGGLEMEVLPCDSNGMFSVVLAFNYLNTATTFTVAGNGNNYGIFSYTDLPITIGGLIGDGTTVYEFVITDSDNPNCTVFGTTTALNCNMDCELFTPIVDPLQCTSDSTFSLYLDFDYANISGASFTVVSSGDFIGSYSYTDLPLEIQDFPSTGTGSVSLLICDDEEPNCCTETTFEGLECGNLCNIFEVFAEPTVCDQGLFLVELDMEYQNPGPLGFQVFGNGNNYGNYSYDDLPITIGAFEGDGTTVYEFVVADLTNQDCANFTTVTAVNCLDQCTITDLAAQSLGCDNGEFMVALSFTSNNVSDAGYSVSGNGTVYGTFSYGETAVVGPFPGDGSTVYEFLVTDMENENCTAIIEVESPNCVGTAVNDPFEGQVAIRYDFIGDQVMVDMETPFTETSTLMIYDATGKLQYEIEIAAGEYKHLVDASGLGSGLYIVQLRNSKGTMSRTFVRAR